MFVLNGYKFIIKTLLVMRIRSYQILILGNNKGLINWLTILFTKDYYYEVY